MLSTILLPANAVPGTSRSPGLDGVITARAPAPPEAAKIAEEEEQEEGGRMTQAKNEEGVNFLPDSLGGAADSRHILDQVREGEMMPPWSQ